ncbi:MAG: hypothetical protein RMK74_12045 [Myxococcales bacterium]|nr:hypothetical protein [Myxococcales bacterium]
MKAKLQSAVEMWKVTAFAELAVWEARPDLQLVCRGAAASGRLDDAALDAVLPGLSASGRRNYLRHLVYLRLVDDAGRLTNLGRHCVEAGEAPAWELGVYDFWVAVHSGFGHHMIDFEHVDPDARHSDFSGLLDVPDWFVAEEERVWTSASDPKQKFTVRALPAPRCRLEKLADATLVWTIDPHSGDNEWHIEGALPRQKGNVDFRSHGAPVPAKELAGLMHAWDPRWDARMKRVLMPYDGGAREGRESFRRTFRYREVKVGRYGTFDEVVVEDVPVGPSDPTEARSWALDIAIGRIAAAGVYCSEAMWQKHWNASVHGTPLEVGAGSPPSVDEVIRSWPGAVSPRTRWLLAAPADLGME